LRVLPGFILNNAIYHKGTGSNKEVIQISSLMGKYSMNNNFKYSIYVSGPKKDGRRICPIQFNTNTLEDLEGQIANQKVKQL
jgi:hypothetical protein